MRIGALYKGKGTCEFAVWAPLVKNVLLKIISPEARLIPMVRDESGYWKTTAEGLFPGVRYVYRIDNEKDRPDPASRFQPDGVHGTSEVIDPEEFVWEDNHWKGIPLDAFVIYELHTGTFTPEGTFEAIISRLDYLKELGVTAIEIMPVAQFPGAKNWGYDGVYPFAPQNSYGGPSGLKTFVNACHTKGLAVVLDVVYNHLGPDGNYLSDFAPYFTFQYKTPWGEAINFDGPYSDHVRSYFIQNALYWVTEYHIDALRLDAIDTIYDSRPKHVLAELAEAVHGRAHELGRMIFVTVESDLNDVKVINSPETGGYGIDAQWNDDFHHSLHTLLTGERNGYYGDFGKLEQMAKSFREGFVYSGEYSDYRKRKHGSSSKEREPGQFIVCAQNHDQVGNRMLGERLSSIVSFEQLKLAASCVILSPFIPLLFMGEEYGEKAPFQYFVSHIQETLVEAVRKGRTQEFARFAWNGEVPDPQDEKTFLRSRIDPDLRLSGEHRILFDYYRLLLHYRKSRPALSVLTKAVDVIAYERERVIFGRRQHKNSQIFTLFSFNEGPCVVGITIPMGRWTRLIDSSASSWGGPGEQAGEALSSQGKSVILHLNPHNAVLYEFSGKVP